MEEKKRRAILGIGVTGEALVRYFLARGEEILLLDKKRREPFLGLPIYPDEISYLEGVDELIVSPGVAEEHPLRLEAKRRAISLTSEIEIALASLAEEAVTLFAITGSCGKTTTTSLVTHVLQKRGLEARSYGNIGYPLINYWEEKKSHLVVELSSFQLAQLKPRKAFDAALILNIFPNHLDYHRTMEEYVKAKISLATLLKEGAPFFISHEIAKEFSHFIPSEKNICFFDKEKIASFFSLSYRDGRFREFSGDRQNCQAAFSLCQEAGVTRTDFLAESASFQKAEHRFEFVRTIKEVTYINDSKATSVKAVQEAMGAIKGRVLLIAGGIDKGSDFTPWKESFIKQLSSLLLIGKSAPQLAMLFSSSCPVIELGTLENAVSYAATHALPGDVVLLSPGCASYDQFENYEHRGKRFKELVLELEGSL